MGFVQQPSIDLAVEDHRLRRRTCRRQSDTVFGFPGAARARLLLAAGKILAQLRRRPLAASRLGFGERPFSTISARRRTARATARLALIFRLIRHGCVITDERKIGKSLTDL